MSKEEQNKMVPKLRFPEFEGPWNYLEGDELFEQISDKEHNSDLPILAITQEQGAVPRNLIDFHVSVTDKSVESYKVVQIGDFIISLRSFQGGIEYSEYIGLCSPAYIILRKKRSDEMVNDFYRHYFKSKTFIRDLNRNLEGIRDGKMVSYKQFSEIKSPIPSSAEQQKIADCLSTLDELIAAQTSKLEALKNQKKGLMQSVFPSENKNVPKLRFPEFSNDGNWRKETLGDVTYSVSERNKEGKILPIYSINNVEGFIPQSAQFEGMDSHSRGYDVSLYKLIGKNTFAYNPARINVGSIGFSGDLDNIIISSLYVCFKATKHLNNRFLYYFLKSDTFNEFVKKGVEGGIRSYLFYENLAKINIQFPDVTEQKKIADFLSSIDALITVQTEKVAQLKLHKKGLIQGLFPTLNSNENG